MNHTLLLVIIYLAINLATNSASRSSDFGKNVWQTRGDVTAPPALTKCHKDNRDWMEKCVDKAFDSWKYYKMLDYANDQQLSKASCCAMWDARDCQMKIANSQCNQEAINELYDSWEEGIRLWTRVSNCYQYSYYYNSAKCKLTDWAIALIAIGCIALTALIAFVVFICIKRRNKRRSRSRSLNFSSTYYR